MNVFAKFDEIPSVILQDIKETKRYGHTFVRSLGRMNNVKTVYTPTNTVCDGYNYIQHVRIQKIFTGGPASAQGKSNKVLPFQNQ